MKAEVVDTVNTLFSSKT